MFNVGFSGHSVRNGMRMKCPNHLLTENFCGGNDPTNIGARIKQSYATRGETLRVGTNES